MRRPAITIVEDTAIELERPVVNATAQYAAAPTPIETGDELFPVIVVGAGFFHGSNSLIAKPYTSTLSKVHEVLAATFQETSGAIIIGVSVMSRQ